MTKVKHIKVSGTAYECGFQIGVQAKEEIHKTIEAYKEIFLNFGNKSWKDAQEQGAKFIEIIEKYNANMIEEMKGISAGAEVEFIDIVTINARTEIMSTNDGCTSVVALHESTVNGDVLLGQNWDWMEPIKGCLIVVEIAQDNYPKLLMCTEAGIIGKIGLNEHGIGVCLNFLSDDRTQYGVPVHIILRGILNSQLFSQAIGQIARMPRGSAGNYLIAHKDGESLSVETTISDYDVLYPNDDILTHSNHFFGPKSIHINDTSRLKFPDTHFRNLRAHKLLNKQKGKITEQVLKDVLADHFNYPDSICRHCGSLPPLLGRDVPSDTVFSIVMNLNKLEAGISIGQGCCTPYELYKLL